MNSADNPLLPQGSMRDSHNPCADMTPHQAAATTCKGPKPCQLDKHFLAGQAVQLPPGQALDYEYGVY